MTQDMILMVLINLAILAGGFVLLIKGADFFVKGASTIAHKFGVPQIVIGLTVVAMGTSAPEAAVSISAALSGNADITIGNVLGSNIMNIFVILGLTALVAPILVDRDAIKVDMPFMLGVSIILIPLGMTGYLVDRVEGLVLLALFTAYMVYLFRRAIKGSNEDAVVRVIDDLQDAALPRIVEEISGRRKPDPAAAPDRAVLFHERLKPLRIRLSHFVAYIDRASRNRAENRVHPCLGMLRKEHIPVSGIKCARPQGIVGILHRVLDESFRRIRDEIVAGSRKGG